MSDTVDAKNVLFKIGDVFDVVKGFLVNENTESRAAVTVLEAGCAYVNELDELLDRLSDNDRNK